jgi:maltose alpha-D-glucosyltransferase/alpha-amylase
MVLAQADQNTRFGTIDINPTDSRQWVDKIFEKFTHAFHIISRLQLRESELLENFQHKITDTLNALAEVAIGGKAIRIHGDLNLAQILVVAGDAYFVNFGEIASSNLHPQTLHQSPLKDVADILCSFNDAATFAIRNAKATDVSGDEEEITQLISAYINQANKTFLNSYFVAASELSQHWLKRDSELAALRLFCLENRFNEILKAEQRPDWLEIPLRDLANQAAGMPLDWNGETSVL